MLMLRGSNFNKTRRLGSASRRFVYSKKTYANPFFREKKQRIAGNSSVRGKLLAIAVLVIIAILVWLFIFSNLFKINAITITGVDGAATEEIKKIAWQQAGDKLIGKNNLLIFDKNQLEQALNDKYYLANISIKKKLFHTLTINLIQKQQVAVWQEEDKYYYLDNQGGIINQVDPLNIDRLAYPLIENLSGLKIDGRTAKIDQQTINYIINLFNEFSGQKHNLEIEKFIVDQNVNTVKLAVLGGPKIFFNTRQTIEKQAARLDLIIKDNLKDAFKTKEYVDLRYDNNIYIK